MKFINLQIVYLSISLEIIVSLFQLNNNRFSIDATSETTIGPRLVSLVYHSRRDRNMVMKVLKISLCIFVCLL